MKSSARVVLGLDEREVAEEVMHFLDRDGARVVATAEDPRQLHAAIQQLEPDAVIASPRLVRSGPSMNGSVLLALDTAESVRSLRTSITRSIADVVPVADELTAQHLDDVLWRHPEGFRALLGPVDPVAGDDLDGALFASVVQVARRSCELTVLAAPRHLGSGTRVALHEADRALIVLSLDVFSFRDAQRALAVLEGDVDPGSIGFLVNRAHRAEVTPKDVERVFGRPPLAVLPFDRRAADAQDRGRLLPRRSKLGRAFDRLAGLLLEEEERE